MIKGRYYYMVSPMAVGIFEMTMMRIRGELNYKKWAELFIQYLHGSDDFYNANCKSGEKL
jgi:hypothetical protein